jgi:large subunit ribosomal protein L24
MKMRVKTGDTVKVSTGKDRGKTGKVIQTFPKIGRVAVEGVNVCKRHIRPRRRGDKGQVVSFSMPLSASNVKILGEDGKATRHKQRNRAQGTGHGEVANASEGGKEKRNV